MKTDYPDYKEKQTFEEVRETFSNKNKEIINNFMLYCSSSACASSQFKIKSKLIQITDICEKDMDTLTLADYRAFLCLLNKSNRAPSTKNDIIKVLKRFIRFQFPDWEAKFNRLREGKLDLKHEARQIDKKDLLTQEEMNQILQSVDSIKYKTILVLMSELANRPEELLKLKWKNVDLEAGEIRLYSSKTKSKRTIPINEAISHLQRYKTECCPKSKNEDFVFSNPKNKNGYMSLQALSDMLNKIEKKLDFKKKLYPYLWRHSVLTRMIKTLSPKIYEMYSGHSLETGMKVYAHLDGDDLRNELSDKIYKEKPITLDKRNEYEKKLDNFETTQEQMKEDLRYLMKIMIKIAKEDIAVIDFEPEKMKNILKIIK